jgi:hypothetical protein
MDRIGPFLARLKEKTMLRSLSVATVACLLASLAACDTGPQSRTKTAVNTALTGACLAAQATPCTIAKSDETKAANRKAKRSSEAASASKDAASADSDAAKRSSCLTDTGPRLPVQASQCAAYGRSYSREDIERTGRSDTAAALQALDPAITSSH